MANDSRSYSHLAGSPVANPSAPAPSQAPLRTRAEGAVAESEAPDLANKLVDLLRVEYALADAYQHALDQLDTTEQPALSKGLGEGMAAHDRQIHDLLSALSEIGAVAPEPAGARQRRTRSEMAHAASGGPGPVLDELAQNELRATGAYAAALAHERTHCVADVLERGAAMTRSARQWLMAHRAA